MCTNGSKVLMPTIGTLHQASIKVNTTHMNRILIEYSWKSFIHILCTLYSIMNKRNTFAQTLSNIGKMLTAYNPTHTRYKQTYNLHHNSKASTHQAYMIITALIISTAYAHFTIQTPHNTTLRSPYGCHIHHPSHKASTTLPYPNLIPTQKHTNCHLTHTTRTTHTFNTTHKPHSTHRHHQIHNSHPPQTPKKLRSHITTHGITP